MKRYSNLIGIDDTPFGRGRRLGPRLVGVVTAKHRVDGVLSAPVRRDGANAARCIAEMIRESTFDEHIQAVLLQGITVGGFNVVDIGWLAERLGRPVVVVARRKPRLGAIRRALETKVTGGATKWKLIERAGPMEACGDVFVQRAGITLAATERLIRDSTTHGSLPEPLRLAHLIAGGMTDGHSRGRA